MATRNAAAVLREMAAVKANVQNPDLRSRMLADLESELSRLYGVGVGANLSLPGMGNSDSVADAPKKR